MNGRRRRTFEAVGGGPGHGSARAMLLVLLACAAGLATAAVAFPGVPAGDRAPLVLADLLGDDVLDAAPASQDSGQPRATGARVVPAQSTRIAAPQRSRPAPHLVTVTLDVAAPLPPAWVGRTPAGVDRRTGRPARGSAGIRAPPASSI